MRTKLEGRLIEEWELVAPPKFRARWDHVPRPPFRAQAWKVSPDLHPARAASAELYDTFDVAMERIVKVFVPPEQGVTAMILDESFSVMFGVDANRERVAYDGGIVGVFGVQAAFEWLENSGRYDMMQLALWEARARAHAEGGEIDDHPHV